MKLEEDQKFWDLYRHTGDFFARDIKEDAREKYGGYLKGDIIARLSPSDDENFACGWIVRKEDGIPYLISFYEQMDFIMIITAKVQLLQT
ncbi:MAG: hypothetical protein ACTSRW_07885 [Candidatus Helarchaeota archaeon]